MTEEKDLRAQLVEALEAADPETAWYYDRRRERVVSVARGEVSDPLLRARDVEDDELRFVEIPAVAEAEVHGWIEEFVEETGDPEVAACLDDRAGANARFEERLARKAPAVLTSWNRFRRARVGEQADAWLASVRSERVPEGGSLAGGDGDDG